MNLRQSKRDVLRLVRHSAGLLASPRYRAWRRTLRSLTLDPETLPRPLAPPSDKDFLICGSPRSGTALLVAQLFQPPKVVTVMEPWDALRMAPGPLFRSLRDELRLTGRLSRGRLDIERLLREGDVAWCRDGEKPHDVELEDEFLLGIKMPAFWRYLDLLPDTRFLVCLRDPVDVVRSYRTTGGRLAEGLDYDVPFNRGMNDALLAATRDQTTRRVLMYDYINRRIADHLNRPNVLAVRYERWFHDPDGQLAEIGRFLGVSLTQPRTAIRAPRSYPARQPSPEDLADREAVSRMCETAQLLGYPVHNESSST